MVRPSILHLGRPLCEYNLSCPEPPSCPQPQNLPSLDNNEPAGASVVVEDTNTSSACSPVPPLSTTDNTLTSQHSPMNNMSSAHQPFLVNPVLSFIKAFRLKSDMDTLKRVAADRFSCTAVDSAKKDLWNFCSEELLTANLPFHSRRDSDKRSQLTANLEDIIQAFDVLDSSDSIPSIFCEANDLIFMPPLCLDPTANQVQKNTEILQNLVSQIQSLEKKFPSVPLIPQSTAPSYAQAASTLPAQPVNATPSSSTRTSSMETSTFTDSRACNLVLFGLPENDSILKLKSEIDELLEFLSGRSINVNDVFRLGKYSASSNRPRPVLIKLTTAWDRKIILLKKRSLKGFKVPRLFIREDVPPDHKFRQRVSYDPPKDIPKRLPSPMRSSPDNLSNHSNSDSHLRCSEPPAIPLTTSDQPSDPANSTSPSHTASTLTTAVIDIQGPAPQHDGST